MDEDDRKKGLAWLEPLVWVLGLVVAAFATFVVMLHLVFDSIQ